MLEKQLYQRIKEIEESYRGNTARWMRVENVLLPGVPDINYCINGIEGWLELKCPPVKANEKSSVFGGGHGVSPAQLAWALSQSRAGGRCFLLTGNEHFTCLHDMCWLSEHYSATALNKLSRQEFIRLAVAYSGRKLDKAAWTDMRGHLMEEGDLFNDLL